MKQSILTVFLSAVLFPALSAQTPLYILFDATCMNQMEYQYTYNGQSLLMCSYARDDNELYFFLLDSQTSSPAAANPPKGSVSCKDVPISTHVMSAINAGSKLTYIVFKQQNGYVSTPVKSGGYVVRSGTSFAFRSPNYDFVLDTANIDYARNLSQPQVKSPVYLTGRRDKDCLRLYSFRLEPATKESPRADVEVIPGIGIISDRTGKTGVEMEQNIYRLLKINGMNLDDYIYAYCRILEKAGTSSTGTFITNVPQTPGGSTGAFDPYEFAEPDKEAYSAPIDSSKQKLANCPEKPGYGYHIVQPGESLNAIARIYNLSSKSLLEWNNIPNPEMLKVCDKIWLSQQGAGKPPPPQAVNYHVVQKSETLVGIARKHNLTEARIRRLNNFPPSGNVVIQPGQKIIVSEQSTTQPANTPQQSQPTNYNPSPPAAANSNTVGRMIYETKKGETLNSVAWKFGYTTPYLRHINKANNSIPPGVSDDAIIPEGVALIVSDGKGGRDDFSTFSPPPPNSSPAGKQAISGAPNSNSQLQLAQKPNVTGFEYVGEYIVKPGDTFQSIGQLYSLPPEKLAAANGLKPDQELTPGSILKIPK